MKIIVSVWKNGNANSKTGAGFGIRIPNKYYRVFKNWEVIIFDKCGFSLMRNDKMFTEKCPEIRSKLIGQYLILKRLKLNWEKRNPHKLELIMIKSKSNHWKLKLKK